jgi:hypothetical protein
MSWLSCHRLAWTLSCLPSVFDTSLWRRMYVFSKPVDINNKDSFGITEAEVVG